MKRKYHDDYDLTKIEDRKKYIDAMNKRIKSTAEAFGTDSTVYKKMVTNIKQLFFDRSIIKEKDDGLIQLSRAKEFMEKDSTFQNLEKQKYLNRPTTNEYLQQTLDKMKERGEIENDVKLNQQLQGPPTKEGIFPTIKHQVIEYTKKVTELSDDIRDDYAFLYGHEDDAEIQSAINTLNIKGRRKTYEELTEIKNAIEKAKKIEHYYYDDPYKDF